MIGSPQSISSGVRTLVTIDALAANTVAGNIPSAWDASESAIVPSAVGETFVLRLDLAITQAEPGSDKSVELELDIGDPGNTVVDIARRTLPLLKGQGTAMRFSPAFPIFCGATFNANGGRFYVTSDVGITLTAKGLMLTRV